MAGRTAATDRMRTASETSVPARRSDAKYPEDVCHVRADVTALKIVPPGKMRPTVRRPASAAVHRIRSNVPMANAYPSTSFVMRLLDAAMGVMNRHISVAEGLEGGSRSIVL